MMLSHLVTRLARENPELDAIKNLLQENLLFQEVMSSLARLRQEKAPTNAALHRPSISIDELDSLLFHSFPNVSALHEAGIKLSKTRAATLARRQNQSDGPSSSGNVGGRPSLVHNAAMIETVKEVLRSNVKESERIAVIGRGNKRRMVVAEHLTSSRYKLWCENPSLHQAMAWPTFCKLLKVHLPHVRGARRNTDICKHCKHFTKYLLPSAQRASLKQRRAIEAIVPSYFSEFDNSPLVGTLQQNKKEVELLARLRRFINQKNANARNEALRQSLSLTDRLALHSCEAQAAHVLKPHLDLLEAYEWHQVSARRQGDYLASLRASLPPKTAVLQMDFKENVKYPLSPEETSEEWHAQNKLSLTVFGANALLPKIGGGCHEVFFLLVSEVLDHDAQAACMMTNTILNHIRRLPDVAWSSVENLVIVADCGPHFRSYENVAHFCVTLPRVLKMSVEICWLGEQHGKSGVDRCFGWCNHWISDYINRKHIYNIEDLVQCFQAWPPKAYLSFLPQPKAC